MSEDTKDPLAAAVEEARAKHPHRKNLYPIDTPAGILVLGKPGLARYEAYLTLQASDDPKDKAIARKTLLLACAVEPSPEALAAIIADPEGFPGLPLYAPLISLTFDIVGSQKADAAKK